MQRRKSRLVAIVIAMLALSACIGEAAPAAETPAEQPYTSLPDTPIPLPQETQTPLLPSQATPQPDNTFPTPTVLQIQIAEQPFENGWMFALLERHEIWVLIFTHDNGGQWLTFPDEYQEGDPDLSLGATPPEGLVEPIRGFGLVWHERLTDEQRQAIGWGTWEEIGFTTTYRYEPNGYIDPDGDFVPRPGSHVLINWGGDVFTFNEASSSFTYEPAS
jgi:hypothetical protein